MSHFCDSAFEQCRNDFRVAQISRQAQETAACCANAFDSFCGLDNVDPNNVTTGFGEAGCHTLT
ncbi:hypothetical protein SRABI106_03626 [Rahnella aquatilis]|nr:hypothetical protein SRABI106_03626 [Rahnella aquatilis]